MLSLGCLRCYSTFQSELACQPDQAVYAGTRTFDQCHGCIAVQTVGSSSKSWFEVSHLVQTKSLSLLLIMGAVSSRCATRPPRGEMSLSGSWVEHSVPLKMARSILAPRLAELTARYPPSFPTHRRAQRG